MVPQQQVVVIGIEDSLSARGTNAVISVCRTAERRFRQVDKAYAAILADQTFRNCPDR
jgi:hypothetical protein